MPTDVKPEALGRAVTLDAARQCLNACDAGQESNVCTVGAFTCASAGYEFGREVQLSPIVRVIVLSFLHHGGLFAYGAHGELLASRDTGSVGSFQVFDFDQDGQQELITEEQDGEGTGTETRTYRIYRISAGRFELLWQGLSYSFEGNFQPPEERQGFIRFVSSGWGDPHIRLVHLEGDTNSGQFSQRVFVMVDGEFREGKEVTVRGTR